MGRPKIHDAATRDALAVAAERLFETEGAAAVSVRKVAAAAGTTTRAVYTLFGSQEGLLFEALGVRTFSLLTEALSDHPETDDPVHDLVEMGIDVFRTFVLEHPALFQIVFQRAISGFDAGAELQSVRQHTLVVLRGKVARLKARGGLGSGDVETRTAEYEALLEGLGNLERRGAILRMLPRGREEETWRGALRALVTGFAHT
jgi:AcrR family transcriptional regulator